MCLAAAVSLILIRARLLRDQPDFVAGQPVHHAAVVDVALPHDHVGHRELGHQQQQPSDAAANTHRHVTVTSIDIDNKGLYRHTQKL